MYSSVALCVRHPACVQMALKVGGEQLGEEEGGRRRREKTRMMRRKEPPPERSASVLDFYTSVAWLESSSFTASALTTAALRRDQASLLL